MVMADIVFESGEGIVEADEDENIESSTPTERTDPSDDNDSGSSSSSSSGGGSDDSSSSNDSGNDYVLRDGEGNVISREDDASDVGYNDDTSPENNDSGGSSSGSNNDLDIEPIKDPSKLEARTPDKPVKGPEKVEVKKSVTVEDQNTKVPTPDGNTITRADQITREAEAEETRRNLQNTAEFLEKKGRDKQASEFRDEAQKARQQEKQLEQKINEITQTSQENQAIKEKNTEIKVQRFLNKDLTNQAGRPSQFQQNLPNPKNNPLQNATRDFFNPNRQVSRNLDFSEEAVLAGQNIIQESEKFGERFENRLPDETSNLVSTVGGGIAGAEQAAQGKPFEGIKTFVLPGEQNQLEKKRSEQVLEGAGAGPGTLAGFTLGGSGAVATSIENRSVGQDLIQGGGRIAGQASENPGEFAASELGEEIGEGLATAGIGFAAPTITPEVTPSVTVPESAKTTDSFIRGDLGTRARETQLRLNTQDTEFVRTNTETDPESGARLQTVEGRRITPGGTELTTGEGFRAETPVTRTEFLKDRLGINNLDKPSDIIDTGNTLGSGVGAFVPETKTTSPETDTTPDNRFDTENLFDETQSPQSRLPDNVQFSANNPRRATVIPELEQGFRNQLNQDQGSRQDLREVNPPFETFEPFNTQFSSETQTNTPRNRLETGSVSTQTETFNQIENLFTPSQTSSSTASSTPEIDQDQETNNDGFFDSFSREQERNVRRSVGADILDLQDSDLTRDQATNPLSLRGLDEN